MDGAKRIQDQKDEEWGCVFMGSPISGTYPPDKTEDEIKSYLEHSKLCWKCGMDFYSEGATGFSEKELKTKKGKFWWLRYKLCLDSHDTDHHYVVMREDRV